MTHDLSKRVALVTGALRGSGAVIALTLASRRGGCDQLSRQSRIKPKRCAPHPRGRTRQLHSRGRGDERQVHELTESVERQFGPIDVLVVNATGPQPMRKIEELTWCTCLDQLEFFVKSPMLLVQAVLPKMKAARFGRIIQIGSEVFELGVPEFSNYVSAKGAQLA